MDRLKTDYCPKFAYGAKDPVYSGSITKNRKEFTGKEFDNDGADAGGENGMGLYYFGARYYDPDIGRWVSTDPSEQFFDLYAYAGNGKNPINSRDENGESILGITAFLVTVAVISIVIAGTVKMAKVIEKSIEKQNKAVAGGLENVSEVQQLTTEIQNLQSKAGTLSATGATIAGTITENPIPSTIAITPSIVQPSETTPVKTTPKTTTPVKTTPKTTAPVKTTPKTTTPVKTTTTKTPKKTVTTQPKQPQKDIGTKLK